jgi:hypothetical protein
MAIHEFTTRTLLHIFDMVSSKGKKYDGVWELENIRAWHDFDGYTCWLAYKDLTATLLFHGKLSVEYEDIDTLNEFTTKCKLISTDVDLT